MPLMGMCARVLGNCKLLATLVEMRVLVDPESSSALQMSVLPVGPFSNT